MAEKILHILRSNKFSGAENVVCQIINIFKTDKNFEMVYVSPEGPIKDTLKEKNINYIPIKKLSFLEIKRVINEYKPDVIHAHDFTASVLVAITKFNGNVISHLHNNPPFIKKWRTKVDFIQLVCA